jgi:hypothetical protein
MTDKPVQKLLPFDAPADLGPISAALRHEPSADAVAAYDRLENWLLDARGRPLTELGEETLRAVGKELIEGKNGWWHKAEDNLEALKLRNGKTEGEDIRSGEGDFQQVVETVLDCLHERLTRPSLPGH